jgi:SSS family solute:Na+ symporter
LVRFGQFATVILVFVSLGWIPFMKSLMSGGIFHYLQSVQAYISPPIAAVFLFGLFYKWINAKGAIASLWSGFIIGVLRLVTEFLHNEGSFVVAEDSFLGVFIGINFLHFAIFLFFFCASILMIVSKLSTPQSLESLELVTFKSRKLRPSFKWSTDMTLTIVLIGLVLMLWTLFSPWGIAN